MKITILIPHYKTGEMTAYTVHQLLKYKGRHDVDIIIINNHPGDSSLSLLRPYSSEIKIYDYPADKLQSHGIAFDYAQMGLMDADTEYFITIESDSFPTMDNWLDYYEGLIEKGYDAAGSLLKLSGGTYMHPAGALYRSSIWFEAKKYCDAIQYAYLPNIAVKHGFTYHLMVENNLFSEFCKTPETFIELSNGYKENTPLQIAEKAIAYSPVVGPFHNGMGQIQESVATYGFRNPSMAKIDIPIQNNEGLIYRVGYEPGQWFHYYMMAMDKKVFYIPTKTVWMPNRENQQQEYTEMENGFRHLWGVSSYNGCTTDDVQDIVRFKANQVDQLYQSIKTPTNAGA